MINTGYAIGLILVMTLTTMLTRFLPFFIFERGGKVPKIVEFLGNALPPAIMSFLLIYCVRDIDFAAAADFAPQLIAVATAIVLHAIKRNTFLSIGVSTVLYMVLVQFVF